MLLFVCLFCSFWDFNVWSFALQDEKHYFKSHILERKMRTTDGEKEQAIKNKANILTKGRYLLLVSMFALNTRVLSAFGGYVCQVFLFLFCLPE